MSKHPISYKNPGYTVFRNSRHFGQAHRCKQKQSHTQRDPTKRHRNTGSGPRLKFAHSFGTGHAAPYGSGSHHRHLRCPKNGKRKFQCNERRPKNPDAYADNPRRGDHICRTATRSNTGPDRPVRTAPPFCCFARCYCIC